jgi:PAS domain S-box-containing protein
VSQDGLIDFINNVFTIEYGWTNDDLLGQPLTVIIPPHFRDTHRLGFSRFLSTEKKTLIGKVLRLPILLKDGSIAQAEHFIFAEKNGDRWRFASTIVKQAKAGKQ